MNPEIPREELAGVLDEVVMEVLTQAGVEGPPVNALRVARALGMSVAWDQRQTGRARLVRTTGFSNRPTASILLRPEPRQERRQWAVAHEIGEHNAVHVFLKLGLDPRIAPPETRETIANYLASRMLLPRQWFRTVALEVESDLLEMKRRFSTASHEMIARRMLDFDEPTIITIFDQQKVTFRRGNLATSTPPLSDAEADCQRLAYTHDKPCQSIADDRQIDAWPVHEEDWRREIVRILIPEVFA